MAEQWILDLTKELQLPHNPPAQELCSKSIYRIPEIITDINSQACEPKLTSFGPYHHNCRHLLPTELHKRRTLMQFLCHIARDSKNPNDVLIDMRMVEPHLIASYEALQVEWYDEDFLDSCHSRRRFCPCDMHKRDEFLKVMIVDGCFTLEIMLVAKRSTAGERSEYDSHDPIFGAEKKSHFVPVLKRDMLLLEN